MDCKIPGSFSFENCYFPVYLKFFHIRKKILCWSVPSSQWIGKKAKRCNLLRIWEGATSPLSVFSAAHVGILTITQDVQTHCYFKVSLLSVPLVETYFKWETACWLVLVSFCQCLCTCGGDKCKLLGSHKAFSCFTYLRCKLWRGIIFYTVFLLLFPY